MVYRKFQENPDLNGHELNFYMSSSFKEIYFPIREDIIGFWLQI